MTQITVPDDVARLIIGATQPIVLVDTKGRTIGQVDPASCRSEQLDPEVALALQRMEDAKSGGKFYSTTEILQHLQASE